MNKLTTTIALALILSACSAQAQQSPQHTFRDASGRTIGTATRSGNQTIYRDDRGRTTGTATVDSQGNITFRDAGGRTQGTRTAPRTQR